MSARIAWQTAFDHHTFASECRNVHWLGNPSFGIVVHRHRTAEGRARGGERCPQTQADSESAAASESKDNVEEKRQGRHQDKS